MEIEVREQLVAGVARQRIVGEGGGVKALFQGETGSLVVAELVAFHRDAGGFADHHAAEQVAGGGVIADLAGGGPAEHESEFAVAAQLVVFDHGGRLASGGKYPPRLFHR